jgi:hypothetical protein
VGPPYLAYQIDLFCRLCVGRERRDELRQVGTVDLADLAGQA